MKLGLNKDEVKLVPYTSEWNAEFMRVKQQIKDATNIGDNHIEHIGSTAIIGMVAKPIIDILVGVEDIALVDTSLMKDLKKIGFLRLKVERPGEIVFAKFTDDTYEVKTHYIHLVDFEKELWNNLLFFRDYLNAIVNAREEYKKMKITYAERENMEITEYTDLKGPFVKSIYEKRKSRS
ncbi:GrpB family protein [Psychrobacillus sp. NPDC096426]|uniref:GrpB family protein n=1 Tax=Psychrobacillus sp. NPDC096426 TaxID=3364491 RepID=UPI00380FD97D